ncbi:hypothetical protein FISHEDRAFT_69940 [Fistulina hepatica ATCC 64428]|uniref:Stress response protein NST1 n=1 Tax=Fistulina hepatica ATCC 64428 TaxID=1128425 RepID=A0A0D7AKI0_9AGAR|nr:hypothetical protein FISHEDRAFT_69940 [Fistulina hepatica ATCC 64428]
MPESVVAPHPFPPHLSLSAGARTDRGVQSPLQQAKGKTIAPPPPLPSLPPPKDAIPPPPANFIEAWHSWSPQRRREFAAYAEGRLGPLDGDVLPMDPPLVQPQSPPSQPLRRTPSRVAADAGMDELQQALHNLEEQHSRLEAACERLEREADKCDRRDAGDRERERDRASCEFVFESRVGVGHRGRRAAPAAGFGKEFMDAVVDGVGRSLTDGMTGKAKYRTHPDAIRVTNELVATAQVLYSNMDERAGRGADPDAAADMREGLDEEYWESFPPHIRNFAQAMYGIAQQMVSSGKNSGDGKNGLPFDPSVFTDPAFNRSIREAAEALAPDPMNDFGYPGDEAYVDGGTFVSNGAAFEGRYVPQDGGFVGNGTYVAEGFVAPEGGFEETMYAEFTSDEEEAPPPPPVEEKPRVTPTAKKKHVTQAPKSGEAKRTTLPMTPPAVAPPPSSVSIGKKPMAYPAPNAASPAKSARAASKAPVHAYPSNTNTNSTTTATANSNSKSKVTATSNQPRNNAPAKIWSTSTTEERERIKDFWLGLGEEERRNLVKIEKDTVLRKMKEQQRHSCSCAVCGRKRNAIEEELEVLYDAYYDELEQYANLQQRYLSGSLSTPPPGPGPFPGSVELDKDGAVVAVGGTPIHPNGKPTSKYKQQAQTMYKQPPAARNYKSPPGGGRHPPPPPEDDDEDEYEEDEYEEDEDEEGDEEDAEDEDDELPPPQSRNPRGDSRNGVRPPRRDGFFNLSNSLMAGPGNILTVADDLLKNDGQKFLEMMEQLAERRMQREEAAAADVEGSSDEGSEDEGEESDEGSEDVSDEGSEEDEEDDEDEDEEMTEEQKMTEGKRMFSIFAARMFEQRVLQAYREKVAQERQLQLLRELEDEDKLSKEREAKKATQNQKKKDKKRHKQAKESERAQREAAKVAEEAKLALAEEEQRKKREEERAKKREEERARKEEERRKLDGERAKREKRARKEREEKAQREREERQRKEEEKARKEEERRKQEKARKEREEKAREQRERREREEREKREREEKARREREEKAHKEREEKAKDDKARQERERKAKEKSEKEERERKAKEKREDEARAGPTPSQAGPSAGPSHANSAPATVNGVRKGNLRRPAGPTLTPLPPSAILQAAPAQLPSSAPLTPQHSMPHMFNHPPSISPFGYQGPPNLQQGPPGLQMAPNLPHGQMLQGAPGMSLPQGIQQGPSGMQNPPLVSSALPRYAGFMSNMAGPSTPVVPSSPGPMQAQVQQSMGLQQSQVQLGHPTQIAPPNSAPVIPGQNVVPPPIGPPGGKVRRRTITPIGHPAPIGTPSTVAPIGTPVGPIARPSLSEIHPPNGIAPIARPSPSSGESSSPRRSPSPSSKVLRPAASAPKLSASPKLGSSALAADDDEVVVPSSAGGRRNTGNWGAGSSGQWGAGVVGVNVGPVGAPASTWANLPIGHRAVWAPPNSAGPEWTAFFQAVSQEFPSSASHPPPPSPH